jgi:AcrR family transcriptional regulator
MTRETLDRPPTAAKVARKGRAAPLPPTERRAAIISATLPLLLVHGPAVTTRQIAAAAGIAEGTIFRVFPDIESLLQATVDSAYDPAQVATELAAISASASFERRLTEAVRILQNRLTSIWQLLSISGIPKPAGLGAARPRPADRPDVAALVALLEPHRHRIRRSPETAARLLRGLTLAGTHPALTAEAGPMPPEEIVSLLLDGMRNRSRQQAEA